MSFRNFIYFNNQDYSALQYEYQNQTGLFVDDTFPADDSSLSPTNKILNLTSVEWKRPFEICENSCLFERGISIHDVCQGNLGNCWLLSALAVLSQHQECLQKVIPYMGDQEWFNNKSHKYTGLFRFCFWRFGEWIQVIIDDRLPCINGKLIFAHSKDINEFWCSLVEKAYAKINGSYESLIGGLTCESLVDFTGGVPEQIFDVRKYGNSTVEMSNLFKLLQFDWKDGSLMCASIASRGNEVEEKLENGLITTHAYSITGVYKLNIKNSILHDRYKEDYLMCLKLRNPWGMKEWNGALSDHSREWKSISLTKKVSMGWKIDNDGEFWILLNDFLKNFDQITIVRKIKTGIFKYNSNWYGNSVKGYWTDIANDRKSALAELGGGGQFKIDITKPDGDIFLLHLLQKCQRGQETALGVIIAEVERNRNFMVHSQMFCNVKLEYRLGGSRSICLRYRLNCGTYIIKPFLTIGTKYTKFPVYFLLRCFTTVENYLKLLPMEPPLPETKCLCKDKDKSIIISRLQIMQADLLVSVQEFDVKKVFCEVVCENQVLKTGLNKSNVGLIWDESFLLFRNKLDMPVIVKMIHQGRIINSLIGYTSFRYDSNQINTEHLLESINDIFDPKYNKLSTIVKNLKVTWYHTNNPMNL